MRDGGGKQKGSSFERACCKDLSLWMSGGEREDIFWRSSMSGGRSTVALKRGVKLASQAGDITSVDALGQALTNFFYIECKHYRELDILSIHKGTGRLAKFWKVAKAESIKYAKSPMLIAKQNNQPIMVCLKTAGLKLFNYNWKACRLIAPHMDLNILYWEDFLKIEWKP